MNKRDVTRLALTHQRPPYVPWQIGLTQEAADKLRAAVGDLDAALDNHQMWAGWGGAWTDLGQERKRDPWGVVWDRSRDHDIGVIQGRVLPEPTLAGWQEPDHRDPATWKGLAESVAGAPDRFRVFAIGFSLYERAWTLRGMEELMADMIEHPEFVDALLTRICDWNLAVVQEALRHDFDAVYFGDDWGSQRGMQMGAKRWRRFILPHLRRMYAAVRGAGKMVLIHSCGDVDEVFPDLVDAGLTCFNPFQPEVMDVDALFAQYRGRLAFHGGLSTQRTLPQGSPDAVRAETRHLLGQGAQGGYIFSPAHAIEGDVPAENMLAMLEVLQAQPGYRASLDGKRLRVA